MQTILSGQASQPQIAAFLMALRMKGETVGRAGRLRARHAARWPCRWMPGLNGEPLLDTCGTGGDGARHVQHFHRGGVRGGRRRRARGQARQPLASRASAAAPTCWKRWASTSPCRPAQSARAIREVGIGFLFAPAVHTAMRHAQPVRVDLKMRTVFNLLGPLTNPAGATAQLVGAPSPALGRTDGRCAGGARTAARIRGARLRRPGRDHHHGTHPGLRSRRRPGAAPGNWSREISPFPRQGPKTSKAATSSEMPRSHAPCCRDRGGLSGISCLPMPPRAW